MKDEMISNNAITTIGVTNWRGLGKKFGIKARDRSGHMYIVGKTGTGKSTLNANLIIADIEHGHGLALIDPHGDLAETVLQYIPDERREDVIYFNAADLEFPIAFNPLDHARPDQKHLVVSGLLSVFKKLWPDFWGPRLEHILRHALLTLQEYPGSTLLLLPRLLTDAEFRKGIVTCLTQHEVRDFWMGEFEKYSAKFRSEAVSPILNKVGQFLTSLPLRNIVGQKQNTFRLRNVMDEGEILIVNLSKGRIGEDNCALLGSMLVTETYLAALGRADVPEENRRQFYLYVDEFHTFLTLSFVDILSEARKYGLSLILTHQYISQLDERVRDAVLGNVGTIVSFRVGAEDATYLAKEFYPIFNASDLCGLPNYEMYLKLLIDGVSSAPFSAMTIPLSKEATVNALAVINESRQRYGKLRKAVEQSIVAQYRTELQSNKNPAQWRLL